MTVLSENTRNQYNADGNQTVFPYTFRILDENHLRVVLTDPVGNDTDLVLNSDYTVDGVGDATGGNITTAQTYDSGYIITIVRDVFATQETDYVENDPFPAESHEDALDKLTMLVQQMMEELSRCPTLAVSSSLSNLLLPVSASRAIGWDSSGTGLTTYATESVIDPTWDSIQNHGNSLPQMVSDIGTDEVTVLIDVTTDEVTSDLSIPSNIHLVSLKGSLIPTASGITLTINQFEAGHYQVFTGDGSVVFGSGAVTEVYPEWWGAVGDGITNDTDAINKAVTSLVNGGKVYFQPQMYLVGNITLKSHVNLCGSGWSTILKKKSNAMYILTCDSGSADVSNNISNFSIKDMQLEGLSVDVGFSEHHHAININGVSDILIERCKITEFEGDGIYLGSSNTPSTERHNERVTIRNCYFDGVNEENRNGITVIDGTDINIEDNFFTRCSRSDMPGPICVEPNGNTFTRIRNISVSNNVFDDCGESAACVVFSLTNGLNWTIPPTNFNITGNYIKSNCTSSYGLLVRINDTTTPTLITSSDPRNNFIVNNNFFLAPQSLAFAGVHGLQFSNNVFDGYYLVVGSLEADDHFNVVDVRISNNVVKSIGEGLGAITIGLAEQVSIHHNKIVPAKYGIQFSGSADPDVSVSSSDISITNNQFVGSLSNVIHLYEHTLTPESTIISDNTDDGGNVSISSTVGSSYQRDIDIVSSYDTSQLPDDFPIGESISIVNGDTNAPDSYHQGLLRTLKGIVSTDYRKFVIQWYYPANNDVTTLADIYFRKGESGSNTWSAWQKLTGS